MDKKFKTPLEHLKTSGKLFAGGVTNLLLFLYTGIKWLFSHHPNYTWIVLALVFFVWHYVSIHKARAERDCYSQENAILIDSISRITMQRGSYVTMQNVPISVIKPIKDTTNANPKN